MLARYLADRFARNRLAAAALEGGVAVAVNLILALGKLALAAGVDSLALLADAAHTASDLATSLIMVVGFRAAHRPPDHEHPYGHGRLEQITALALSLALLWAGLSLAWAGWRRSGHLNVPVVPGWSPVVLLALAGAKEWLARFSLYLGRRMNAQALIADGWHHRADALSGAAVACSLALSRLGYPRVDSLLGMAIGLLVVRTGGSVARRAVSSLLGERASDQLVDGITGVARAVPGVERAGSVRVHHYGDHRVVSLHIEVRPNLNVEDSHLIATVVEEKVRAHALGAEVVVHVEPAVARACDHGY
jgi:cation diffusion facilitator family transporter